MDAMNREYSRFQLVLDFVHQYEVELPREWRETVADGWNGRWRKQAIQMSKCAGFAGAPRETNTMSSHSSWWKTPWNKDLPGGQNAPKGNSSEPTPVIQVQTVSFREGNHLFSAILISGRRWDILDREEDGQLQALWWCDSPVYDWWVWPAKGYCRSPGHPMILYHVILLMEEILHQLIWRISHYFHYL